jgi:hypothetical protein
MMPLKSEFMGKAYGALKSELGRRACREGWGIALHDFIAEQGVWPDHDQQDQIRAQAAEIEAAKPKWPAVFRDAHTRKAQRFERIVNGLK